MRISDWSSDVCNSARAASGSAAANATGSGEAMAFGNLGQLAATGSGEANGSGMFAVSPGMTIQDARGKAIGTVQSVRSNGQVVVQSAIVERGNRVAELPAANFTGSGTALVSAMGKSEVKKEASQPEAAAKD